jgi:hypothetical protein
MAVAAERKAAKRIEPSTDAIEELNEHDEALLDPHEVLDRLEPIEPSEIDKAPRGIIYGTLIGAAVWAFIYAIYVLAV